MNLPAEWNILLACLGESIKCTHASTTESLLQTQKDWTAFTKLVHRHKVAPLIYPILSRHAQVIPHDILSTFKTHCLSNSYHVLNMLRELRSLSLLFQEAGICSLSLKGPLLAKQLYGNLALRESLDLDLLISVQDVERAHSLLLQAGYFCITPTQRSLSTKQFAFYLRQKKSFVYYSHASKVQLELHWRFFDDQQLFPFSIEQNWDSLAREDLAGLTLATLSPKDNLLYLSTHGSKHAWSRLSWLKDIAELLQATSLDWEPYLERAKELRLQLYLGEGLLLAHHLFGSPLPLPIKALIKQHTIIESLAKFSLRIMQQDYLSKRARLLILRRDLRLHATLGSYFRPIKELVDIVAADWEIIRLPDKLFFLYYFLRPFLWLWRKVSKSFNKKLTSSSN